MPLDPAKYNQRSFTGGMNLLLDDTRLEQNQYRLGVNITNRFDELDLIPSSIKDTSAPAGKKQGLISVGNYLVMFVAGKAYYRAYNQVGWIFIDGFQMDINAPRYWFAAVPVATTNYVRYAQKSTMGQGNITLDPKIGINLSNAAGASGGNLPGLLVQDNINQPLFVFLDGNGIPTVRETQSFEEWSITFTDAFGNTVVQDGDKREYVPIGNCMAWEDGILYIVSQDFTKIYRSVTGRPLDFVVAVKSELPKEADGFKITGGGDADTTAYSVGVGGISCIRTSSSGGLFVSASGANFLVTKNQTPGAPTEFGEYTYIRKFLFNAFCLSDKTIFDSDGDTRFIDLGGIRSFNAVEQLQNEGRNSAFSSTVQPLFTLYNSANAISTLVQSKDAGAAILFDNYELYGVKTLLGNAILKRDTINDCWTSIDLKQLGGGLPLQFAAMQIDVLALFAITDKDEVYQLYADTSKQDIGYVRTAGICSTTPYGSENVKLDNPDTEIKMVNARAIINKVTKRGTITCLPYINNVPSDEVRKTITPAKNKNITIDPYALSDSNTTLRNLIFPTPNAAQGWKVYCTFQWTTGVLTQFSFEMTNMKPMNPIASQNNE